MCLPGCQETVHRTLSRRGLFMGAAATAASLASLRVTTARAEMKASKVVDLTHTMSPEFPTFFGVPGISFDKKFDFAKDGFNLNWWNIVEHAGTHMDAPLHFSKDGKAVDAIAATELVAPLAVIDVRSQAAANPDYQVTKADIEAWEAANGKLPAGAVVAMLSGWGAFVTDAAKFTGKDDAGFHFPGFGADAAEFLLKEREIVGIAVDTLSLDHGQSKDFKVHYMWLPSGRYGLENVANLDQVPAAGATVVIGVAKVKDATGGPTRVFALV